MSASKGETLVGIATHMTASQVDQVAANSPLSPQSPKAFAHLRALYVRLHCNRCIQHIHAPLIPLTVLLVLFCWLVEASAFLCASSAASLAFFSASAGTAQKLTELQ